MFDWNFGVRTFQIIGPTTPTDPYGTVHIDATMVGSSGDLAGSKGHATFDGQLINGPEAGSGTYRGWWSPGHLSPRSNF